MRISDWSSDVCSSDLLRRLRLLRHCLVDEAGQEATQLGKQLVDPGRATAGLVFVEQGIVGAEPEGIGFRGGHFAGENEHRPEGLGESIEVTDRKSVVSGKSVAVRVDLGGRRNIKKKKQTR